MNANFFISTYRPIPIEEYLVYENTIYPAATSRQLFQTISKLKSSPATSFTDTMPPHRVIQPSKSRELSNQMTNSMVALAIETAGAGYGALVFCGSRQGCQIHAAIISEAMPMLPEVDPEELGKRLDLVADLRSLPTGLDPVFEKTLPRGVGFHREWLVRLLVSVYGLIMLISRCGNDYRGTRVNCASLRSRGA